MSTENGSPFGFFPLVLGGSGADLPLPPHVRTGGTGDTSRSAAPAFGIVPAVAAHRGRLALPQRACADAGHTPVTVGQGAIAPVGGQMAPLALPEPLLPVRAGLCDRTARVPRPELSRSIQTPGPAPLPRRRDATPRARWSDRRIATAGCCGRRGSRRAHGSPPRRGTLRTATRRTRDPAAPRPMRACRRSRRGARRARWRGGRDSRGAADRRFPRSPLRGSARSSARPPAPCCSAPRTVPTGLSSMSGRPSVSRPATTATRTSRRRGAGASRREPQAAARSARTARGRARRGRARQDTRRAAWS